MPESAHLSRPIRVVMISLNGMLAMCLMMSLALLPDAHAADATPVLWDGPARFLLIYAGVALGAAGIAALAARFLRPDGLIAIAAACPLSIAFIPGALAAEGSTLVDVSSLAETSLWMANAVLVPVLGWIGTLLFKKLKLDRIVAEAAMNRMLHAGLQRSVDAFEGMIRDQIFKEGKPLTIDVHSEAVAAVSNRMIELSPDLLKRLNITEERLSQLAAETIAARTTPAAAAIAA
jgi:hypothetical protein